MQANTEITVGVKISRTELERRWEAVRTVMKESGIDFLIMQNFTDFLGGYVKWFTDISARQDYPFSLIFPREDEMTTVRHGPQRTIESGPPGIKKQIGVPSLPSLCFTGTLEAEAVVSELLKYSKCHIGFVGLSHITASFYKFIVQNLTEAVFTDATTLVDQIKAIKSEEEINHIEHVCALQDNTFQYALTIIKPGRKEFEIYADLMHQCLKTGSDQANLMVGSAPYGGLTKGPRMRDSNRLIREGDKIDILVESNGPSGFFAELGRTVFIGKAPQELQEQFEITKKIQKISLDLLKPETDPMFIWEANNNFARKEGYPEEKRLLSHGMGYDMVERPSVQIGETMKIQAGMNMAGHASITSEKTTQPLVENYIVTSSGNRCLHKTPQKIFEV